jgi:hypothetical protein
MIFFFWCNSKTLTKSDGLKAQNNTWEEDKNNLCDRKDCVIIDRWQHFEFEWVARKNDPRNNSTLLRSKAGKVIRDKWVVFSRRHHLLFINDAASLCDLYCRYRRYDPDHEAPVSIASSQQLHDEDLSRCIEHRILLYTNLHLVDVFHGVYQPWRQYEVNGSPSYKRNQTRSAIHYWVHQLVSLLRAGLSLVQELANIS